MPELYGTADGQTTSWLSIVDTGGADVTYLVSESADFALYNSAKNSALMLRANRLSWAASTIRSHCGYRRAMRVHASTGWALPVIPYLAEPDDVAKGGNRKLRETGRRSVPAQSGPAGRVACVGRGPSDKLYATQFRELDRNGPSVSRIVLAKTVRISDGVSAELAIKDPDPKLVDLLERTSCSW